MHASTPYRGCVLKVTPDGKTLFVCNRFNDDVSVIDLSTAEENARIAVSREPVAAAITPDAGPDMTVLADSRATILADTIPPLPFITRTSPR